MEITILELITLWLAHGEFFFLEFITLWFADQRGLFLELINLWFAHGEAFFIFRTYKSVVYTPNLSSVKESALAALCD